MNYPDLPMKLEAHLTSDPVFRQIYEYTRQRFDHATELSAHNWEHARRDVLNALVIGESEGANLEIVLPAAVLHDIGFLYGAAAKDHGHVGAGKLEKYLTDGHIDLPSDKRAHIADCIRTHKGSVHGETPLSLEAKVVADADLLDKFGPIGLYQNLRSFTEFNLSLPEILSRFKRYENLEMHTATGSTLAQPLRPYAAKFLSELEAAYLPYQLEQS